MPQIEEHVGMEYPTLSDSRYVAQAVNNCLFPWEGEASFSDARIALSKPPIEPLAMESSPTSCSNENVQIFKNSAV